MRLPGVAMSGSLGGTAFPPLLRRRAELRRRCSAAISSSLSSPASDHASFINSVAATRPPEHLNYLCGLLRAKGETVVPPGSRQGLIPLVIPLSENQSGVLTALLRWPTAPPGMEMPVVEVRRHGVWLLAKSVDLYIHRLLAEEDAKHSYDRNGMLFEAASMAGEKLYKVGDFANSRISDLDVYLLKKVGLFPDILERRVTRHLDKGDHVSAMVAAEFYGKGHFPGFARPFVFNAEVLLKIGRKMKAKDAARAALKSPWWTLGCSYHDVATIAEWEDEQIEYIKERVSEEGRQEDMKKGKPLAQIALDQAAFLLDLASIEGTWTDFVEQIGECYKEAGLDEMAKFILYRDS